MRPVITGTTTTDELAETISYYTTFSPGTIHGLITTLGIEIARCLGNSQNVKLDGIGTFSFTLEGPTVKNAKEVRSEHVKLKKILFRADPQLKNAVGANQIQRVLRSKKRARYTEEQRRERILWYIGRYGYIYKTTARELNNCSHYAAVKDLNLLIDSGTIKMIHTGRYNMYVTV